MAKMVKTEIQKFNKRKRKTQPILSPQLWSELIEEKSTLNHPTKNAIRYVLNPQHKEYLL